MNNALYPNGLPRNLTHFEGTNLSIDTVEQMLAECVDGCDAQMATLCYMALNAPAAEANLIAQKIERILFAEAA